MRNTLVGLLAGPSGRVIIEFDGNEITPMRGLSQARPNGPELVHIVVLAGLFSITFLKGRIFESRQESFSTPFPKFTFEKKVFSFNTNLSHNINLYLRIKIFRNPACQNVPYLFYIHIHTKPFNKHPSIHRSADPSVSLVLV